MSVADFSCNWACWEAAEGVTECKKLFWDIYPAEVAWCRETMAAAYDVQTIFDLITYSPYLEAVA